jgi:hypothetical protein
MKTLNFQKLSFYFYLAYIVKKIESERVYKNIDCIFIIKELDSF